jgi:hypothetical protein
MKYLVFTKMKVGFVQQQSWAEWIQIFLLREAARPDPRWITWIHPHGARSLPRGSGFSTSSGEGKNRK